MATRTAKNYMRAEANKRLEKAVNALAEKQGVEPVTLDIHIRDKEMIPIMVTERMADFIESLLDTEVHSNTVPQRYLDAEQLAQSGATKAEIVAALLGDES